MRKVVITLEVAAHTEGEELIEECITDAITSGVINPRDGERIVSIEVEAHPEDDFGSGDND
jgi:hypothetical protein